MNQHESTTTLIHLKPEVLVNIQQSKKKRYNSSAMRAYWSLQFNDSIRRSRKIDQTHSFVSWAQSLRTCLPQEGLEDTNEYQCNKIVGEIVEFKTKGKRDKAESGLYQQCDAPYYHPWISGATTHGLGNFRNLWHRNLPYWFETNIIRS